MKATRDRRVALTSLANLRNFANGLANDKRRKPLVLSAKQRKTMGDENADALETRSIDGSIDSKLDNELGEFAKAVARRADTLMAKVEKS